MHPAKSVIFFTTASGAGYGLLVWLGVFGAAGLLPEGRGFAFAAFLLSLGLVTAGLLASTAHLGRPERAWRALSQWRSSWLSREGVAVVATYVPAGLFGFWLVVLDAPGGVAILFGLLAAVGALVTVYCTAMIYASLKPVRAWHTGWTTLCYLALALMTGALLLQALVTLWAPVATRPVGVVVLVATALAFAAKHFYWRAMDDTRGASTAETATGLGAFGKVTMLDPPHSEENYLLKEMGFRIARKHAVRLRTIVLVCAFALPFAATALALLVGGALATGLAVIAVPVAAIGTAAERWLFFAQAKHAVTLYYGEAVA